MQGLSHLHNLRRSSDTVGFKPKCKTVPTTLTTVYSLETPPILWTALQPQILQVIYTMQEGVAPIYGCRGLDVCWISAA